MNRFGMIIVLAVAAAAGADAQEKIRALIVDGQNNHDWQACTPILKWVLEDTGRFTVDVSTSPPAAPPAPRAPRGEMTAEQKVALAAARQAWEKTAAEHAARIAPQWTSWRPAFTNYAVVVMNYTGDDWPVVVQEDFEAYVREGGGLVIFHAADNAFPAWPAYNAMIGVGGWGGRDEKSGPMVRWRDGKIVYDTSPGRGGSHGEQHEFVVETREPAHPIMAGLPARWRHAKDELYSQLRGPAAHLTVLATAFAAPETRGSGEHEPILMTIDYGKGRVFHTVLGHGPEAMSGVGFQITLARGTEWAATGAVTLPPPAPGALAGDKVAVRPMPTP